MRAEEFYARVNKIVARAIELKDKYTDEKKAPIDYVAIFTHSVGEYREFVNVAGELGSVAETTKTGNVYRLHESIVTKAGKLLLVKVRKPDASRPHMGDADFIVDYDKAKGKYIGKKGFKIAISSMKKEMIEISDPDYDVLVYFSKTPLTQELGIQ